MSVTIPYVINMSSNTQRDTDGVAPSQTRNRPETSGFTFHGTETYIVGHGDAAVVDPGPMIDEHIQAFKAAA